MAIYSGQGGFGSNLATRDNRGADLLGHGVSYDTNAQSDGSYTPEQLWRFMWDLRFEPNWRREAEIDNAYYDGDQLKMPTLIRMKELGIPPIIVNMMAPALDSVAGWEVVSRSDLRCIPETEESYPIAQGLNVKFKEAQRLMRFNHKVGKQFKDCIKTGISWVEVGRNPDPFGYPYAMTIPPWREMYWDYRSREPDLSDVRFIVRRKWYDFDVLMRVFPQHKEMIRNSMNGYAEGWLNEWEEIGYSDIASQLASSIDAEQRFSLEEDEWRQQHRGRVALYEILYYVPDAVEALRFRDGYVVELDRKSPEHLAALRDNQAMYVKGVTKNWRQAYYAGPHRLADQGLRTNRPHYIPMVAYRKDNDGSVYGLARRMRSPQEAINARHARMLYDLSSRKYFIDDDAVDNVGATAKELNKVTSMVVLKGDRRGEQGIVAVPATDTSAVTFQMLQEAKMNIFDVTGLHPEFQGRIQSAGQSGTAIESLIEQASQVLGVVVDNYRYAKTMAGEALMQLIVDDLGEFDDLEVETDEDTSGSRQKIILNARREDGERDNEILMARIRVALGEAPASVTYAQQKFQSLVEVVKSMPEQMQAAMMDLIVRAATLPDSEEMLERIREMTGFGPEPKDPEKREALRAKMAEQQEAQKMMRELEMRISAAEAALKEATAELNAAKAAKTEGADTELTDAKTMTELATADTVGDEQDRKDRDTQAKAIEAAGRLRKEDNADAAAKPPAKPPAKKK